MDERRPLEAADRPGEGPGRAAAGVLVGLLVAAVSLGVAQLFAAFVSLASGPVVAVGAAMVDLSPEPVKSFAITTFGTNDKPALVAGIVVVLAGLAAILGVVSLRRRWVGFAALAALGAAGAAAALTRPDATALWALPSIAGALAGAVAFYRLWRAASSAPESEVGEATVPTAPGQIGRRTFIRSAVATGVVAAVAGVSGKALGDWLSAADASRAAVRLPTPGSVAAPLAAGGQLHVPGLSSFYTPDGDFYRVDTALIVPRLTTQGWNLRIHGMVEHEVELDFEQLLALPQVERDITLCCVSNPVGGPYVGNARWVGTLLRPLLERVGVRPGADQIVSRSSDGMTIGTPTALATDGRDSMLAVGMNGQPLPLEHGFPVRMIVPGLYGYESATKWLVDIELTSYGAYSPYWASRGWAKETPIKTESRIDTPRSGSRRAPGTVPVAGVAWAQGRGIERVQVRVDAGPWHDAELSAPDNVNTWRQWLYRWDATPGRHRLTARATDGTGAIQTSRLAQPYPSGATGWHTISVTVG